MIREGGGNEARNVRPGQARQDHLLHFEPDDGARIVAPADERHLHDEGTVETAVRHAPERGHPASVQLFVKLEAVDDRSGPEWARCHRPYRPARRRALKEIGRPASRTLRAALSTS